MSLRHQVGAPENSACHEQDPVGEREDVLSHQDDIVPTRKGFSQDRRPQDAIPPDGPIDVPRTHFGGGNGGAGLANTPPALLAVKAKEADFLSGGESGD
jgi:hypothetical protein